MSNKFSNLKKKTTDVISGFDATDICYMEIERGFTDIKSLLSKRNKK